MNQEGEVPTRVTRGALRRRSTDQDATPQNPPTSSTNAAGGTPKKATGTKKGPTLGAIPENQGRSSTPVGRVTRRMSETIDTPTTVSNKLVQQLKNSEVLIGSGQLSTSLTEENVHQLNASNDYRSTTTRTRTPARLRGSQETLASTTPQTVPVATRRSTRRNSITSDDGGNSVQSLPVTTPRTPVLRSFKDEIILEEDSDDRTEATLSDASSRSTRRLLSALKSASQSPRREPASPLLNMRHDATPPPGRYSPKEKSSSRTKVSTPTPRSKNVSFADDSKQEDKQSGYPKTPTSPGTKFVVVGMNDLRNTQLISGLPKVNAEIQLINNSVEKDTNAEREQEKETSSAADNTVNITDVVEREEEDIKNAKTAPPSSADAKPNAVEPQQASANKANTSSVLAAERSLVISSNDVSGIEELESSLLPEIDTSTGNVSNGQIVDENNKKMPKYWSPKVRGTSDKGIDAFVVGKQNDDPAEDEKKELNAAQIYPGTEAGNATERKQRTETEQEEDDRDSAEEEEQNASEKSQNEFVDDEAMEVDGYESGDSLDSETRREMEMNEVIPDGESIGSEDTVDDEEDELYVEDENDSFLASDEEEALLEGSGDDLTMDCESPAKAPKEKTPSPCRIVVDDREGNLLENDKHSTLNSDVNSPVSNNCSASCDKKPSPEKEVDHSVDKSDDSKTPEKLSAAKQIMSVASAKSDKSDTFEEEAIADNPTQSETKVAFDSAMKTTPSNRTLLEKGDESGGSAVEASEQNGSLEKSIEKHEESLASSETRITEYGSFVEREQTVKDATCPRKSLPVGSATVGLESGKSLFRKSLPANTKMHFVEEEVATTDLQPSSSNLEASYQEEEEESEPKEVDLDNGTHITEKSMEQKQPADEGMGVVSIQVEIPASNATSDEEYYEAADDADLESPSKLIDAEPSFGNNEGQPDTKRPDEPPAKPPRMSLPAAPLISAQFYLGGSKKEKHAIINGGDAVAMGNSSTPNRKESTKKKNADLTLVANPFALITAKAKVRSSINVPVAAVQGESHLQTMKPRISLPAKLDKKLSIAQDTKTSQKQQQHDEPEPMEVDEYDDDVVEENGVETQQDDALLDGEREVRKLHTKPKTSMKTAKDLEDFDVERILSRCNEVVRADKERKKQNATFLQKKRDEKRRLRQLREQQQQTTDGKDTIQEKQQNDVNKDEGDEDGVDADQNSAVSTTANESTEQSRDLVKKKNKKKKKLKNYVLEELAVARKERVAVALQRKLESIELRKQRKKERREATLKLLNKENGDHRTASGSASEGIGAKLLKAKKKKQRQKQEAAVVAEAEKNGTAVEQTKLPLKRVALSAFAVFQDLQNAQTKAASLGSSESVPLGAKKNSPVKAHKVVKQQHREEGTKETVKKAEQPGQQRPIAGETKKVEGQHKEPPAPVKYDEEQADGAKQSDKQSKQVQQPRTKDVLEKTMSADAVIVKRKKSDAKNTPALQKAATDSQLTAGKLKRKLEGVNIRTEAATDVPESDPIPTVKKQKKTKSGKTLGSVEEREDTVLLGNRAVFPSTNGHYESAAKPKKGLKKAAKLTLAPRDTETKTKETDVASALREVRAAFDSTQEQKKKTKKLPKKEAKEQEPAHGGGPSSDAKKTVVVSSLREVQPAFDDTVETKKKTKKSQKKEAEQQHGAALAEGASSDAKKTLVANALREVKPAFDDTVETKKKTKKLQKKKVEQQHGSASEEGPSSDAKKTLVASALREVQPAFDDTVETKKKTKKLQKKKVEQQHGPASEEGPSADAKKTIVAAGPTKKRKRDPIDVNSSVTSITPRPTKLRALQRADYGFVEETVTPEKTRLKRNFGFQEKQKTPKAVGFKVSSLLPTQELRALASAEDAKRKHKLGQAVPTLEPTRTLPLPVWTSSGYFFVTPDGKENGVKGGRANKFSPEGNRKKSKTKGSGDHSGYVSLKGGDGIKLKTLPSATGSGSTSAVMAKPHRIDLDTISQSVVSFKRQQLLDKTAHLREKKKGGRA